MSNTHFIKGYAKSVGTVKGGYVSKHVDVYGPLVRMILKDMEALEDLSDDILTIIFNQYGVHFKNIKIENFSNRIQSIYIDSLI